MHLVKRSLQSRDFLLQFFEIMQEFGNDILWLEPLKNIRYSTNGVYFRDQFIRSMGLYDQEEVTIFQFVTPDREHEYVAGVIRFAHVPESFEDLRNKEIQELLLSQGYHFISCLQMRDNYRGCGHGQALMQKALSSILEVHGRVWGVVFNPQLIPWYESLGATVRSSADNEDDLWIISWK